MYGPAFWYVSTSLNDLAMFEQNARDSAKASANNGSLSDGNAPSWRFSTHVFSPAGIGPLDVVAQPTKSDVDIKQGFDVEFGEHGVLKPCRSIPFHYHY